MAAPISLSWPNGLPPGQHTSFPLGLPAGSQFVSNSPAQFPKQMPYPFDNCDNDQKLVGVLSDLWTRTMLAHQPEVDRLQMLEMLYQGFHYRHPRANREKEITNYCFSTVETVYPVMVERRPRPEAVPRPGAILPSSKAEQLQKVATWWQDIAAVDRVRRTQTRVKLKSGYNVTVLTVDPQTGIPFIVDWSPFDFYPDPSARNVELAEYFFFAAPIATRRLKAMFPGMAAKIYADNYVSPSYDAVVRPYIENYAGLSRATRPYSGAGPRATNLESTSPYQSNPQPTGNTNYVFAPYSTAVHRGSDTSFLLQLIVRDYSRWPGVHAGTLLTPAPPEAGPDPLETPWYMPLDYPCCPSGWRLITFLANGTILANEPVDECFDGLPFVVGYDYRHEGRIAGIGEIDNIASINRAINERKNLINQANRLAGNPPLIATKGSGIDWDGQGVTAGDVLEPSRGSDIHWLEYQGPSEHQFEQLQVEYKDIDTVSGVHDAQQGQRPAGIEAAAAIRELQDAAATRIRGKAPEDLDEWARILTKAVKILAKKCRSDLWFHATGGDPTSISPSMLDGEWDFRFTEGTSDQQAKHERDDMALQLFQLGVLGPADLLQQLDWPNGQQIAQNAMLRQMAMAQAQSAGPKGPPPKGGGPPPPNQGGPPPGGQ